MSSKLASLSDVSDKIFDYVIVGAGAAGMTLASRLTENPNVTVVVLEAGEDNLNDPTIIVPAQFGRTFFNPKYDWAFKTEKQKHSNDNAIVWARGKGIGGSTGLNFYAWIKPPAADIDAIEKLGNPGWNWKEYQKYSNRSETFHPPGKEQTDAYPHTYDASFHGHSGPIHTTVPFHYAPVDTLFQKTLVNSGLKTINDPYGGDITGAFMATSSLDPRSWTRSYGATGYYAPAQDRPNLLILTEAMAARVTFADAVAGQELKATGVEFIHGGKTFHVSAKDEVVLSAGSIQSPKILELSGIGRPEVLKNIGVDVKLELPGVGENVQEHMHNGVSYELAGEPETFDKMHNPEFAAEAVRLHGEGAGPLRLGIVSFAYYPLSAITPEASTLIERAAAGLKNVEKPGLREQLDIQFDILRDDALPDLEVIGFPGLFTRFICSLTLPETKSYWTALTVLTHPLSRGTIHAKSADPFDQPTIDPHYFENDFDLESMVQNIKYVRKLAQIEPLKSGLAKEMDPGPECVTDEDLRNYVKNTLCSTWHTIGSCSMLPREKQGVVDPELKVYGTKNLRVVDLSVIPIHFAAHTQATAYVIGEKAADLISAANPHYGHSH
ncbi:GMC oxidoreductase [Mycena epipterygia]|nr:GMC oxidoreductase [Mycena epipterygia]